MQKLYLNSQRFSIEKCHLAATHVDYIEPVPRTSCFGKTRKTYEWHIVFNEPMQFTDLNESDVYQLVICDTVKISYVAFHGFFKWLKPHNGTMVACFLCESL